AANHPVEYVDIEVRTSPAGFRRGKSKIIRSFHDFDGGPASSPDFAGRASEKSHLDDGECNVQKIVCQPKTFKDLIALGTMELESRQFQWENHRTLILGMG